MSAKSKKRKMPLRQQIEQSDLPPKIKAKKLASLSPEPYANAKSKNGFPHHFAGYQPEHMDAQDQVNRNRRKRGKPPLQLED